MEKGYALFIVKPTRNESILHEFEHFLKLRGFTILDTVSKKLTEEQVIDNFFSILQPNVDYLTDGNITAFWCSIQCENISDYVYETKMIFREKYGVKKMQLFNYVHSSDDGLEMMLQKQLLFPQYSTCEYARGCDMYLEISEFEMVSSIEKLLGNNIKSICVIVNSNRELSLANKLSKKYSVA